MPCFDCAEMGEVHAPETCLLGKPHLPFGSDTVWPLSLFYLTCVRSTSHQPIVKDTKAHHKPCFLSSRSPSPAGGPAGFHRPSVVSCSLGSFLLKPGGGGTGEGHRKSAETSSTPCRPLSVRCVPGTVWILVLFACNSSSRTDVEEARPYREQIPGMGDVGPRDWLEGHGG